MLQMIPDEADKVERYVGGLPNNIQGSVMVSKPKILQEAFEFARSLMDQKVRAYATRQSDNKRRMDNNLRDNHAQQPPYKRQNVARAYSAGLGEKRDALQSARTVKDQALVMTIGMNIPVQILNTQAKAMKEENLRGMNKDFEARPDGILCIEK
ncbi:hypothetical protein Tco_1035238 [Tanacetum coccineum]